VRLESARELKRELAGPPQLRGGLLPREMPGVSVPAGRTTDVGAAQPGIALGIAPHGPSDYRLAVRVQHRDLEAGERVAEIERTARGEVDVRYIGRVAKVAGPPDTRRTRPVQIGVSVGHFAITAGTVGAFVRLDGDGAPRLVSNNHVLADENRGTPGDEIIQPGRADGGRSGADRIGALERFVALETDGVNEVDAALATLDPGIEVDPEIPGIGRVSSLAAIEEVEAVVKRGRTTGRTEGRVSAIEVDNVVVEYSAGTLRFDDQVEISGTAQGPFSQGGDSGSMIVSDGAPEAVALLFAGSDQGGAEGYGVTFGNPMAVVFERLGIAGLW
jgi:hypothetical protein